LSNIGRRTLTEDLLFIARRDENLLTHSDAAYLLHVSTGTVCKQAKAYLEKQGRYCQPEELSMISEGQ
jgi:hypothetical protein